MTDKENLAWKDIQYGIQLMYDSKKYPIDKLFKYSSHIPLLMASMNLLPHDRIIECGCGFFSSPVFYHFFKDYFITIDDILSWAEKVEKYFPPKNGFEVIYSKIFFGDPKNPHKLFTHQLTKYQRKTLSIFYDNISSKYKDIDILFIDQEKYARSIAIKKLSKKSKILIYHDAQHAGRFGYQIVKSLFDNKNYYRYIYKLGNYCTGLVFSKNITFNEQEFRNKMLEFESIYFNLLSEICQDLSYTKSIKHEFIIN